MAIGIVAFGFVAIMGLVPVGLDTFDRSVKATVEANIAQRFFSEAQQVRFSEVGDLATQGRYYDAEGFEVSQGASPSRSFVYHVVMNPPETLFVDNQSLTTVSIDISKNRTVPDLLAEAPSRVKRFSFMVADVGQ